MTNNFDWGNEDSDYKKLIEELSGNVSDEEIESIMTEADL